MYNRLHSVQCKRLFFLSYQMQQRNKRFKKRQQNSAHSDVHLTCSLSGLCSEARQAFYRASPHPVQ